MRVMHVHHFCIVTMIKFMLEKLEFVNMKQIPLIKIKNNLLLRVNILHQYLAEFQQF